MKKVGLIGVIMAALLVISATPAMAGQVSSVSLNATYPGQLLLTDFNVTPTSGTISSTTPTLTITITSVKLTNYYTSLLNGTVFLYVDGARQTSESCEVQQTSNTSGWVQCGITHTFTDLGIYKVSVGNDSDYWLSNVTISVFVKDDGPVSVSGMQIDRFELSDDEIDVGEVLEIYVDYGKNETQTRRIAVIDWATYVSDVQGDTAKLLSKADAVWTLTEGPASDTYTFTPEEPGYYLVVAFNDTVNKILGFKAVATVAGKPTVSISVDKSQIAMGDYVKVSASLSTDVAVNEIKVFVTGGNALYLMCKAENVSVYSVEDACNDNDEWYVPIKLVQVGSPTSYPYGWVEADSPLNFISELPEGIYVAKIDVNYNHPEKRAEAVATFQVVSAEITSLNVPTTHVKGTDLKITGTTNLAKSGTKNDNKTLSPVAENYAYLWILNMNDVPQNLNDEGDKYFRSYIDSDGSFAFKVDDFGETLSTGYYKVIVGIDSDGDVYPGADDPSSVADYLEDQVTTLMQVVKGELTISVDKPTVMRGESFTVTVSTNFKINTLVNVSIDLDELADLYGNESEALCVDLGGYNDTDDDVCIFTKGVDAAGKAEFDFDVATNAELHDYRFKAEDTMGLGLSASVRVEVVKQVLNVTADKTTVVRGDDIKFSGTTVPDQIVCIYASEDDVFKLGDEFVATEADLDDGVCQSTSQVKADGDGVLEFELSVDVDADTGVYYLYLVAPENVSNVDRTTDVQKMISIAVKDPSIVDVIIPSKLPYNGETDVTVVTEPGDYTKASIGYVLEGPNVKVEKDADADLLPVEANNNVTFTLDLESLADEETIDAFEPGIYVLTVKFFLDGEEVDSARTEKLVEVVSQELDVTIEPATPVVGDTLTVKIQTNRMESGYEGIYVTMVGTNVREIFQVTLNSEGYGELTIETLRYSPGTYKLYIRDTAMTEPTEPTNMDIDDFVRNYYALDPADPMAEYFNAHDDLLVVKTIELLETAPTTTTTVVTTTTTPPTTTPPTTTPPTTTPPTTTPPTTTPEQPGGIPGFEAVFAIAGLLAVAYLLRRK